MRSSVSGVPSTSTTVTFPNSRIGWTISIPGLYSDSLSWLPTEPKCQLAASSFDYLIGQVLWQRIPDDTTKYGHDLLGAFVKICSFFGDLNSPESCVTRPTTPLGNL